MRVHLPAIAREEKGGPFFLPFFAGIKKAEPFFGPLA